MIHRETGLETKVASLYFILKLLSLCLGRCVNTGNLRLRIATSLGDLPGLHSKYQASLGYLTSAPVEDKTKGDILPWFFVCWFVFVLFFRT